MSAPNANGSTWFFLHGRDFGGRSRLEAASTGSLGLAWTLLDLEGVVAKGVVSDRAGTTFQIAEDGRGLVRRECEGSDTPFGARDLFARPVALCLDGRGQLLVVDRMARRVVVLDPSSAGVLDILTPALIDPVDVAVDSKGAIFVLDQGANAVVQLDCRHAIVATTLLDRASVRKAVAIWFDEQARCVVMGDDGSAARLDEDGAWEGVEPVVALHTDRPSRDIRVQSILATVRVASEGTALSPILDSRIPSCEWHRVELACEVPGGSSMLVETFTAEDADALQSLPSATSAARENTVLPADPVDRLIFAPPGRFLRLRVTLRSDGLARPWLHTLRATFPRNSFIDLLPRVFRTTPDAGAFVTQLLALVEQQTTRAEDRYDAFSRDLSVDCAPPEWLDWLASLLDLAFDPSWPLGRRRLLLREATRLYATRGTRAALSRAIEIYTGLTPILEEHIPERVEPAQRALSQAVLGALPLGPPAPDSGDDAAHRFTVTLPWVDPNLRPDLERAVERLIELHKPAHTVHELRFDGADGFGLGGVRVGLTTLQGEVESPLVMGTTSLAVALGSGQILGGASSAHGLPSTDAERE